MWSITVFLGCRLGQQHTLFKYYMKWIWNIFFYNLITHYVDFHRLYLLNIWRVILVLTPAYNSKQSFIITSLETLKMHLFPLRPTLLLQPAAVFPTDKIIQLRWWFYWVSGLKFKSYCFLFYVAGSPTASRQMTEARISSELTLFPQLKDYWRSCYQDSFESMWLLLAALLPLTYAPDVPFLFWWRQ